jgi:hypothetical protein
MVGSAVAIGDRSEASTEYNERRKLAWQDRALKVVDLIPELDYASRIYSKMLGPLRLYPAKVKRDGKLEEIKNGPAVDVLDRIRDGGGGKAQILSSYARLALITGEGNLFGYNLDKDNERWIYIWNDELKVERDADGGIKKIVWTPTSTSNPREFGPADAVVYKFWSPHPRRSGEATSPMRAIVEGGIAEELIALTRSVLSTATARSVRGILIVPQEVAPPPAGTEGDEDPEENTWINMIAEHFEAQIDQAGSAAAAAPYLMDPPFEYAEGIRLVELHNPQHDYLEQALRKESVERIARGMDFPMEALTGIGQTNHWAALQILMDLWRSHGAPAAQLFCGDLTSVYLQPALKEMEFPEWKSTVVAYDSSEVTAKPDRSDDAKVALQLGAIGPRGFRSLLGIPEDLAPTEEELKEMMKFRGRQNRQPAPERDAAADGPEQPGPEGDSGRKTRVSASADRKLGVIELAIMRCRELAGIRIRQKAQRHFPDNLAFVDEVPFADVAASLGQELVKEMGIGGAVALVSGGADNLRSLLCVWGYSSEQANLFAEVVEMHAGRTLFEPGFPKLNDEQLAPLQGLEIAA